MKNASIASWRPVARRRRALDDEPLLSFLLRNGQSAGLRRKLWEPLCLAMLNTPLELASTRVFGTVLQTVFGHRRGDADLLIPRGDLDSIFPEPARRFLESRGARLETRQRVTALTLENGTLRGLRTADGRHHAADHVILALPPQACLALLAPHDVFAPLRDGLARLRHAPICTIYLRYPPTVRLEHPMTGLLDGTGQWLFDRGFSGEAGMMAVVISGPGAHMTLSREALGRRVAEELAALHPHWPAPLEIRVIREKHATFLCHSGVQALRPGIASPLPGCWLAGDHVDTDYPATLEGAVRSGLRCARAVMTADPRPTSPA